MACGCPVIASKEGCSPEVVADAAILIDPYRPEEIADALRRILTQDALKKSLVEKGLKRVKEFSWEKCAKETLQVFQDLN